MDDLVSQIAEFHMTVVFTEIIDALLGKNCLDEIMTVTDQNCGNYLDNE